MSRQELQLKCQAHQHASWQTINKWEEPRFDTTFYSALTVMKGLRILPSVPPSGQLLSVDARSNGIDEIRDWESV